jgi:hypothetical protein
MMPRGDVDMNDRMDLRIECADADRVATCAIREGERSELDEVHPVSAARFTALVSGSIIREAGGVHGG